MGFLDIKRATKSYGAVKILHETDISIEEGEFLVLVGPRVAASPRCST